MGTNTENANDDNNNLKINGDHSKSKPNNGFSNQNLTQNTDFDLLNNKLLWEPKKSAIGQNTKLVEFQKLIEKKFYLQFKTYDDLYKWSCENFINFWEEFWNYSNLLHSEPYNKVFF